MAECDAVCEQVHLPLQSGSSRRAEGDAPHLHARALSRARREDARRDPRPRDRHRHHRRLPGRDRGRLRSRRSRWWRRSRYDSAFTFVYSPRAGTEAAAMTGSGAARGEDRADGAPRRDDPADRARAEPRAHRPRRGGARRGLVAHRSDAPPRPHAPQHDGQLHRQRRARRARRRPDRGRDLDDASRSRKRVPSHALVTLDACAS